MRYFLNDAEITEFELIVSVKGRNKGEEIVLDFIDEQGDFHFYRGSFIELN